MMTSTTYKNAPATELLASHCAVCARPLVDSVSVELSMGPVCREKYGVANVNPEHQAAANKIVHEIALLQRGAEVIGLVSELRGLGFEALADRITSRVASRPTITITVEGALLVVNTPYSETAVEDFKGVRGRRFDWDRKVNTFPVNSRLAVWAVLRNNFAGHTATGPKGAFVVTEPITVDAFGEPV